MFTGYIDIEKYYDRLLINIDEDLLSEFKQGCINNFISYVQRETRKSIRVENEKILVSDTLITDEYIKNYFVIKNCDKNAKDCTRMALEHVGFPPLDEMSVGSLEKKILELMRKEPDNVYIKCIKGKVNTFCVDSNTGYKIVSCMDVVSLIQTQVKKAEKNHQGTID